jgi:Plasmid stability protein
MASITIKNIPDPVYKMLKAKAKKNNRSLNSEVINGLQRYMLQSNRDSPYYLEMARKFQDIGKGYLTPEEIEEAKKTGRE